MVQAEQENAVIRAVQERVPFARRPFAEIGEKIGLDEAEVIELLRKWQDQGKLREISAILEGAALGYESDAHHRYIAVVIVDEWTDHALGQTRHHVAFSVTTTSLPPPASLACWVCLPLFFRKAQSPMRKRSSRRWRD